MSRGKRKKKDWTVREILLISVMYHRNTVRRNKKNIVISVSLPAQDFVMGLYIIVTSG